jgi:hypothetical protein
MKNIAACYATEDWDAFRLLIGFINHLQVVTTITYYTTARLHNL